MLRPTVPACAAALLLGCPPPALVAVTPNPESACRFAIQLAEGGESTFPPLSFSPDGRYLVASADIGAAEGRPVVDASIWVYDIDQGDRRRITVHGSAPGGFYPARWSPDGRFIAVATADHVALLTPSGDLVRDLPGPLGMQLSRLAFSADGRMLAVAGNDNVLFFLGVEDGGQIDGDVFRAHIVDIEPEGAGFLVFHEHGEKLHRSFIVPGQRPERRPDVSVKPEGTVAIVDAREVVVHDPDLGARLVVGNDERLLLPGVRGGGKDLLVDAQGFRLSADRRRLAFAKVACGQARCAGTVRVMQCEENALR